MHTRDGIKSVSGVAEGSIERAVLPCVPAPGFRKGGYELSLTRRVCKPQRMRTLAKLDDVRAPTPTPNRHPMSLRWK